MLSHFVAKRFRKIYDFYSFHANKEMVRVKRNVRVCKKFQKEKDFA